jgi:hypothetical protein
LIGEKLNLSWRVDEMIDIEIEHGKKKVKISSDVFGLNLSTTRNGWQWSSLGVDVELLEMINEAIIDLKRIEYEFEDLN